MCLDKRPCIWSHQKVLDRNEAIRNAETYWDGIEPRRVAIQDATGGRLRITLQDEHLLDECPSKGAFLREFEPFSFDKTSVVRAEYEVIDLEPKMPSNRNYRFLTARQLPKATD